MDAEPSTVDSASSDLRGIPNVEHPVLNSASRFICHHPTQDDKDRGYAWVVLCWAFLSAFLNPGIVFGTYGTINLAEQHKFNISVAQASFIGTMVPGCKDFAGLIVSILIKKLSCRVVHIAGGILMVIGFGGCAFATQPWNLYILYGVIGGVGVSCCYLAYPATIVHHFDRHKGMAYAVCALGNLIGTTVWPSLSQELFSRYGYSITMGILGLCQAPQIVAGIFFTQSRPVSEQATNEKFVNRGETRETISNGYGSINSAEYRKEDTIPGGTGAGSVTDSHDESQSLLQADLCRNVEKTTVDARKNTLSAIKVLLADWKVCCLILNFGLWNINMVAYMQFINDYVVKYCGLTEQEAALGVTISGFGALGCVLFLIALGRVNFDRFPLYAITSTIYGGCTIGLAFTQDKIMFYTLAAIWGVGRGILAGTLQVVCVEYVGGDLFPILYGLNMLSQGITGIGVGPFCSYLQIHVHQVSGLCFAGAAGIVATLVLIPVIALRAGCCTSMTRRHQ